MLPRMTAVSNPAGGFEPAAGPSFAIGSGGSMTGTRRKADRQLPPQSQSFSVPVVEPETCSWFIFDGEGWNDVSWDFPAVQKPQAERQLLSGGDIRRLPQWYRRTTEAGRRRPVGFQRQ